MDENEKIQINEDIKKDKEMEITYIYDDISENKVKNKDKEM